MSMQVGGAGTGPKADINVTPLVDVMLVLLIIMMIVAPLLQQGVALTLPIANNSGEKPETQEDTVVAITADGRFHVNGKAVPDTDLRRAVEEAGSGGPDHGPGAAAGRCRAAAHTRPGPGAARAGAP